MKPGLRSWPSIATVLFAVMVAALGAYAAVSAGIALERWAFTYSCGVDDPPDCGALPWTRDRVVRWVGWGSLGVALIAAVLIVARAAFREISLRALALTGALAFACGLAAARWV